MVIADRSPGPLAAACLVVMFLGELIVLGALAWWGASRGSALGLQIALGAGLPLLAALAWGLWGAPRGRRHLRGGRRLLLQACFFGTGAAALAGVASPAAGIAFAVLLALDIAYLRRAGFDR